ncbi:glycolate oxidase iron-sulfur subunit [Mesorhizobium sp. M1A.F.Ca.IN.020.06.1.1]|uniref:glycolate oxidase subunit GlcF n=4 Tax=Mesorhizobium TaxID=68287 RepID=UPI000BAEB507|nr:MULTISPECIES: glycolate oxidase subunit GlcF [unclassified Mesorhizobium]PBB29957.1 glycolate oxidase iron-sulfur subunit [Mesorhizobium sp. WSM3882]RUV06798.1 glycolate oxidase iron-sulfur subunit [Mesorhizobium sp. M1A.F.Ca.IN.020.03.2.1]RUV86602.1 glycolate oxidase iron-sulfur subunit [Mesorhizobium sp. M1A.F.Ca.IN.020.32.1.1]RUW15422.1 glycolate oxidase iron-sulfur subunit [Mesorhizobium sp. M1A.F.Ca.IN.022.05.2.1]RUW36108.1 glycolate oxidase iron-sulfur subunit [Mesorhizobium sp. M1A.F
MQTNFSAAQLADPHVAESEKILRKCVHCGFCTATCPTYVTLGNELDSPRGRIYLIKDMLENGRPADKEIVTHIDRCLSCLACMTTCPSGVNYMHLVDHARAHIEQTYRRPLLDRLTRAMLAFVLPYPGRFRAALKLARLGRPLIGLLEKLPTLKPVAAMLELAPSSIPPASRMATPAVHGGQGTKRGRVAILTGCAQSVLDPAINEAAVSLLTRLGVEVVVPEGEGCCGALVHHLGREDQALASARQNVDAWMRAIDQGGLDAIIITASGCGTTIKDYGFMLRLDPADAEKAARVSALAKDITEYLAALDLPEPVRKPGTIVAYHSACSMQHGQKITRQPKELLAKAGFVVREPREGHLCCGSAGTYNILQPDISAKLRNRKVKNIEATGAEIVATGNIGCITQIASAAKLPVVHTIKLLDWAYGGPKPDGVSENSLGGAE